MRYVGIETQQRRNNMRSSLLLLFFPVLVLVLVAAFCYIFCYCVTGFGETANWIEPATEMFVQTIPWAVGIVGIWFLIAYFANTAMIRHATQAQTLERRDNPRVYNIVENLTMACGMDMPKINIIHSPELNAFASGIDRKSYTVTVTTGICERLDDDELAGVIAHELTHIRNRDTRLLIVSIIFVGIISTVMAFAFRMLWYNIIWGGGSSRSRGNKKDSGASAIVFLAIAAVLAAIGYFFTLLTRFAISRKREYMADAGGAALCGNPLALASALRKISQMPYTTSRDDVQQLFIIHPQALNGSRGNWFKNLFSTHPSTESRIAYLEQF